MGFIVAIAFVVILGALAAAGFFMLRASDTNTEGDDAADAAKRARMARALAIRISVSVVLFLCILLAWGMGWIKPTGIPIGK